jgi:acyl carrier protein
LEEKIRAILSKRGGMADTIASVPREGNLYEAGLTSLATVQVMLSLEEDFDFEFPDSMLNRNTFASIAELQKRIEGLLLERTSR